MAFSRDKGEATLVRSQPVPCTAVAASTRGALVVTRSRRCGPDRTLTSWPTLQTNLRNAGARWVDEEVHVDGDLVSRRKPDDLPAFCRAAVEQFSRARAGTRACAGRTGPAGLHRQPSL